jgi:hypothetical protein
MRSRECEAVRSSHPSSARPDTSTVTKPKFSISCIGSVKLFTNGRVIDLRGHRRPFTLALHPHLSAGLRPKLALSDNSRPIASMRDCVLVCGLSATKNSRSSER